MDHDATRLGSDGHRLEDGIESAALTARKRTEDDDIRAAADKGTGRHMRLRHESGSHGQRG